jgi:hypothetical protein
VVHPGGALLVVAPDELPDPLGRRARHRGDRHGGVPLGQQPEDLARWPPTALVRLVRGPVALLQFVNGEVRVQMKVSCHTHIL